MSGRRADRLPADVDLDAIRAGVQPQAGGRLLCRLCGRWYRSLGHHLRGGHGVAPDAYRQQFELPDMLSLSADDLRERLIERGRHQIATDQRIRVAFAVDNPDQALLERRLAQARKRKQQTESRAGVQASKQAVGALLGEKSRQRAEQRRRDHDDLARARGYRDFAHLLTDNVHLTDAALAGLLGWSAANARWWRRHHDAGTQARSVQTRRRAQNLQQGLDLVPAGVQPQRDRRLRCLLCGRWWQDLSQHVAGTHTMSPAQYRSTFHLPADLPLQGAARLQDHQRLAEQARAAGHSAGRAKSAAARHRWDTTARRHGHPDIVALLLAHPNTTDAAAVLGITPAAVRKIRDRYLTDVQHGLTDHRPSAGGAP